MLHQNKPKCSKDGHFKIYLRFDQPKAHNCKIMAVHLPLKCSLILREYNVVLDLKCVQFYIVQKYAL